VLLLWSVGNQLPEALSVIKAWGFKYKPVGLTWVKQNPNGIGFFKGMGHYTPPTRKLYCWPPEASQSARI
jgi:site-specific DNA-methyltransferase (adenine-specific)